MSFEQMLTLADRDADSVVYDKYYSGMVALDALGVNLPPAVRVLEMAAPFPRIACDVLCEVLTPEGFMLEDEGAEAELKELERLWVKNRMPLKTKLAIREAIIRGCGYFTVSGSGDRTRVQARSCDSTTVEYDWSGNVCEGIHRFSDPTTRADMAVYFTPGRTFLMGKSQGKWVTLASESVPDGMVAIVPIVNQTRISESRGMSEIEQIIKIADGASRTLTGMQFTQESLAAPLRYLFSDHAQNLLDKAKAEGKSQFDLYVSHLMVGPGDAKMGQLSGADLSQFIAAYRLYAEMLSSVTGVPLAMLGVTSDNPASAEAMRASKERLITRAEERQVVFGDALEQAGRLLYAKGTGGSSRVLSMMEAVWRDPATPSLASKAANALQAQAQGVISAETARDFMLLTPAQRRREREFSSSLSELTGLFESQNPSAGSDSVAGEREASVGGK